MQRQRAQQAEAAGQLGTEDVQGEPHQAGRGPLDVAAQRLEACRRLRIEVQLARIDDGLQQGARKLPSGDGLGQRLHDLVLARGAVIDPVQALAPPLQADAADHRLAHHLRRLGHLMVEGIEREEVLALGRSEEHTSELQSLMRISYAVFCWKKKKQMTETK